MPGAGQHPGRLVGELVRAVPRVAADDHSGLGGAGPGDAAPRAAQPAGQRGGRGPDDRAVHPVRPGADRAAQPGGAELQPAAEPVGQLRRGLGAVVTGGQRLELGPVPLVRVVGQPRGQPRAKIVRDHVSRPRQDAGRIGQQRAHPAGGGLSPAAVTSAWSSACPAPGPPPGW